MHTWTRPSLVQNSERQKNIFGLLTFFKTKIGLLFTLVYHDFHMNTFIHFIYVVKQMPKMSGKYQKKNTKLAWKVFFSIPLYHFQSQFSVMGIRNAILQYNTLSMMCILVIGLKRRPQGETENKQRASVRLLLTLFTFDCLSASKVSSFSLHTKYEGFWRSGSDNGLSPCRC